MISESESRLFRGMRRHFCPLAALSRKGAGSCADAKRSVGSATRSANILIYNVRYVSKVINRSGGALRGRAGLRLGSRAPVGRALDDALRAGERIGNADASRGCDLKTVRPCLRKAKPVPGSDGLLAGVPEALPPARVGVVPAEARPGSGARPRRRRRRADEAKRRAGCYGSARRPAVPGTGPTAITVGAAAIDA